MTDLLYVELPDHPPRYGFGSMYGMSPVRLQKIVPVSWSENQCREILDRFYKMFPGMPNPKLEADRAKSRMTL